MNSPVTPDHLVTITEGATTIQIITMIFVGVIAICFVIVVVKWVVGVQLGSIPTELTAIRTELIGLAKQLSKLQGDMWTRDQMDDHIDSAIREHIETCPHHKQQGR